MDMSDETTKANCLAFKKECSALYAVDGHVALAACDFDRAIDLYSVAINLDSTNNTIFGNRSKAKLEKMLWEEALFDAQKPMFILGIHRSLNSIIRLTLDTN
ncbi:hypothetical protein AZE42_02069 [Rhizopogon vesiculosus]|uniref:Uncharacterized protein n=1 Tax=Rhizopogon vesiculosus TaxID=180088 RepID=A0A1J8QFS8_9AGAM|nr:hypothetical protein AZE42_02069 [Rhizopogon vesiculosus]